MKTTTVTAKISPQTKSRAQKTARDLGVSLSLVIDQALKRFSHERELPIQEFIPNAETARAIRQDEKDVKNGKLGPIFRGPKEFIDHLNNLK